MYSLLVRRSWMVGEAGAAVAAQQRLKLGGTQLQRACDGVARRLLSSSPSDDFNREMAEFFGTPAQPQQPGGATGAVSGLSAPAAAAEAATASSGQTPELLSDVHTANAELFGFFGVQQQSAGGGGVASLAQQMAVLAGQAAPSAQPEASRHTTNNFSDSSSASSHPMRSFASSAASTAGSGGGASSSGGLTHVDATGRATMVDVSHKQDTVRTATAAARVLLGPEVFDLVARNQLKKGDVLTVAQLAGVMGAKHTATLIPLCHNILLSKVHVALALDAEATAVDITAAATTVGPTGVEMEALTAAAVAALCVYDMCKAASKGIQITDLRLLSKTGGKSGDWAATAAAAS